MDNYKGFVLEKEIFYKQGKSIIRFTRNTPTTRGIYLYIDKRTIKDNRKIQFTDIRLVEVYPSIGGLWIRENETSSFIGHFVEKYTDYFSQSLFYRD